MKKIFILRLVSLMLVLFFISSCSKFYKSSNNKKENILSNNLEGSILFSSHRTDLHNSVLNGYIREFEKKHIHTKIKIETIKDYTSTLKIKMSSNDLPDVWTVHGNSYNKAALQNYNVNLSQEYPELEKDFLATEIFKGLDGEIYAFPTGIGVSLVVYNKKIFNEVGISVPKTLSELIVSAKKIKESGKTPIGTAAGDGWPLSYYYSVRPLEISGDTEYLNNMEKEKKPFKKGTPIYESYNMLKKFSELGILESDPLSSKWETMKKDFRAGNIGMVILGTWFIPQAVGDSLTEKDIGVFPFPYNDSVENRNVLEGPDVAFAISKDSNNIKLSKKWFEFLINDKYTEYAKECGLKSARKSINVDVFWLEEFNKYNTNVLTFSQQSSKVKEIINKIQFSEGQKIAQDVLSGKDLEKIFDDINNKWSKNIND